jgi:hypothetical protein
MTHVPSHYSLPEHLSRILASPEFAAAAKEAGKTRDELSAAVAQALKSATQEQRREELRAYEQELGAQALTAAVEKAKADKAA